ncbi:metallophos domain-containing protein [Citrus sinensis]|nr:metallophos domain-containing protein [Citrus sinensis]
MTKKYERYICESKVDDDSMVASDLKQFPYTAEEDDPGTAGRRAFCHPKKTGMAGVPNSAIRLSSGQFPNSCQDCMDGVDGYDKVAVITDPQVISLPLPSVAAMLESLNRFKHIFGLKSQDRFRDIRVHFLPGNHDNGYAALLSHKPEIVRRYEKEFGKRNYRFTVGKVEFIVVDAQTLDGHPEGNLAAATWDFVKNVSIDFQLLPRVLLTHIPLYRRDETPCGPHRSSPIINQRIVRTGHSQEILYQNYITEESSNRLLDLIKPVLVLSGHDHDQCTVSHESNHEHIKEQGNLYPSFMLLSASNSALLNMSNLEEAVLTRLCFLPMQTHIYIGYLLLFIVTLVTLLFWPTGGVNFGCHCSDFLAYGKQLFKVGTKEKTEDENCEYEMVWDAEGSMHLVRKATNTPITRAKDTSGTMERGNAVMRHTAKKGNAQEVEISMNVDDPMTNLPPRTSKSTAKFIIHRLVRMFRMLTVIAVVNIPLYMMLLFKDWIDQ